MAEKKKYNSILVSGRKDETLTYSKYVKDEESGESVKESLDKKVNITDELTTQQIKDGAITNEKMASSSVTTEKIKDKNVTNEKLADNAVSTSKIASRSVINEKIAYNSVSRAELTPYLRSSIDNKADSEQVNNSLYNLEKKIGDRFVIEGDVTNLPDEEDLTSVKESERDVLKLADRSYAPYNFSGKGYKILRRNIKQVSIAVTKISVESAPSTDGNLSLSINGKETQVAVSVATDSTTSLVAQKIASALKESMTEYEVLIDTSLITIKRKSSGSVTPSVFSASTTGVVCTITDSTKIEYRNILAQGILSNSNTIYEIRYDFDLDGKTLEVPENCTLKFEGGSINNGTINENYTEIVANDTIIFKNIKLTGTSKTKEFKCTWFGIVTNIDVTDIINDATLNIKNVGGGALLFKSGHYKIYNSILIRDNVSMIGQEYHNNAYYRNDTIFEGFVKDTSYYWMFDTDIVDKETGTRRPYNYFYTVLLANDANRKNKQIFIKNITLYSYCSDSKNSEIYGGLRLLHCVNITLDNICVANTKVGLYISSTWNTSISRLELNTNLYGIIFGVECTNINIDILSCIRREPNYKYSDVDLFDYNYHNVYVKDKYLTGAIIAYNSNIHINNLDCEGWDFICNSIGCIIGIDSFYYERITNYLFYFRTTILVVNVQYGTQYIDDDRKLKNKALYFDSRGSSYVKMNGEYCGDAYFEDSDLNSKLLIGNTYPNKRGVFYALKYDNTNNNIYYDFPSNYIYVSNTYNNDDLGFSKFNPISFDEAIRRIRKDPSYKNKVIYLLDDITANTEVRDNITIEANNHNIFSYLSIVNTSVIINNLFVNTDDTAISVKNSQLTLNNPRIKNKCISASGYGNCVAVNNLSSDSVELYGIFQNTYINSIYGETSVYLNGSRKNSQYLNKTNISDKSYEDCYFKGEIVFDEYMNTYIFDGAGLKEYINSPIKRKIGNSSQRPTNVLFGFIYKNTETNKWEIFNGTNWENLDGTELATTNSNDQGAENPS